MTLEGLPPLREVIARHGLSASRALGQNFLLDEQLLDRIARVPGPLDGALVYEVGPGPGGLTRALLRAGARVMAVERDRRCLAPLAELSEASGGQLEVVEGDALAVEPPAGAHIVANLPYNVGTPLLVKWLTAEPPPASMTLMFQKEVARRIVAQAGSDDYGRLSILSQALCDARIVMDLPARAFTPPPKVDSAVVLLEPKAQRPAPALLRTLEQVTHHAFSQRRKMLRSSLKAIGGEALCKRAGIDPNLRAETVPVDGFLRLAAEI